MTDEAVDSDVKPNPIEQAEVQKRINDAARRARSIIQANELLQAFGIMDLNDPAQKRRALLVEVFVEEQLLADDLAGRKLNSEQAFQVVVSQNEYYLAHPGEYPGAGNIRFAVQTLFEMVHEKTGRSINPEIPIDTRASKPSERIMPQWRARFS
jgi:hypothetical protein